MEDKTCSKCTQTKPSGQFYRGKSYCKQCSKEAHAKWVEANREHRNAYQQRWALRHVAVVKAQKKKWYESNKDKVAGQDRFRRYGLTQEQYGALLLRQDGCCAICKSPEPKGRGRWHVDHDHKTGAVRALLCTGCNLGVGHFRDDPKLLRAAADYLERPPAI
jgi:hypothetical protein